MQLAELEEMRYREANMTALAAIGPRKKPRLDGSSVSILCQVLFKIDLTVNKQECLRGSIKILYSSIIILMVTVKQLSDV